MQHICSFKKKLNWCVLRAYYPQNDLESCVDLGAIYRRSLQLEDGCDEGKSQAESCSYRTDAMRVGIERRVV
jgi:hypothetical protein